MSYLITDYFIEDSSIALSIEKSFTMAKLGRLVL